jgi:UTP:GlnB (protein PII) uridylyltransferase
MLPDELSAYSFSAVKSRTLNECALERARDTVGRVTMGRLLIGNRQLARSALRRTNEPVRDHETACLVVVAPGR